MSIILSILYAYHFYHRALYVIFLRQRISAKEIKNIIMYVHDSIMYVHDNILYVHDNYIVRTR